MAYLLSILCYLHNSASLIKKIKLKFPWLQNKQIKYLFFSHEFKPVSKFQ